MKQHDAHVSQSCHMWPSKQGAALLAGEMAGLKLLFLYVFIAVPVQIQIQHALVYFDLGLKHKGSLIRVTLTR